MTVIPETYANKDWPRKVKQAVEAAVRRVAVLETHTAAVFTFTPTTTPASPTAGMTYFDSGTNKLRTYDGTNWQDHW